jgi:hypothetical protein
MMKVANVYHDPKFPVNPLAAEILNGTAADDEGDERRRFVERQIDSLTALSTAYAANPAEPESTASRPTPLSVMRRRRVC